MSAYQFLVPSLFCAVVLYWLETPTAPTWRDRIHAGAVASILPVLALGMNAALALGVHLRPYTYDLYLYRADVALGLQPAVDWLTSHADRIPGLTPLMWTAYVSVPLAFALVIHDRRTSRQLLWKLATVAAVGYPLYLLVPGCGPVYVPHALLATTPHPILIPYWPRNAMPSLHFSWTLLIFLNRRPWSPQMRMLACLLFGFTAVATVASGQHYAVDLIAALPFALAVNWLVDAPQLQLLESARQLRPTR